MNFIEILEKNSKKIEKGVDGKVWFEGNFNITSPKVDGLFKDIILDGNKLILFDGKSPYGRIILSEDWDSINFM